jgi:hypothetical protein
LHFTTLLPTVARFEHKIVSGFYSIRFWLSESGSTSLCACQNIPTKIIGNILFFFVIFIRKSNRIFYVFVCFGVTFYRYITELCCLVVLRFHLQNDQYIRNTIGAFNINYLPARFDFCDRVALNSIYYILINNEYGVLSMNVIPQRI